MAIVSTCDHFSNTEGIQSGQEYLVDVVVSNYIGVEWEADIG